MMTGPSRRTFLKNFIQGGLAVGAAQRLSATASARQSGGPQRHIDPYALVNPELLDALKTLEAQPQHPLNAETLQIARSVPPFPALPSPAPQPVSEHIPGSNGAPDVGVVIFDPAPKSTNRPAILYIHGGGYIAMSASFFAPELQRMAVDCGCLVVSVDYRLAPETRFPGSLEDNYAALRWIYNNAISLGVDRSRIAIAGASAGGGHAAALAIAARDRKEIPVAFQLLIYPMLDDRTGSTRTVPPHIGTFIWTAEKNVFGWTSLLGVPAGSAVVPAGAVPSRVENLAGLPPAFIGVGSIDLFVEEDIDYAKRLIAAGVPTELYVVPGTYHAFDLWVPNAAVTTRFNQTWITAVRTRLKRS